MTHCARRFFLRLTLVLWVTLGAACSDAGEVTTLTTSVVRGPLTYEGVYHAELRAKESVAVHVPEVADSWQLTVDSVLPDGTRVNEGDVILTFVRETLELDLRDEVDRLEVAKAERRKVSESLERERVELQLELDRRKLALKRAQLAVVEGVNFISEVDLDKARLDVKKAELELELGNESLAAFAKKRATSLRVEDLKIDAAQRAVDLKQKGLSSVDVTAPVSGVLYAPYTRLNWQRTKVEPGVVARPGDRVLEIPDLSAFQAEIYVRPRDATMIKEGDRAMVYPTIAPQTAILAKVVKKEDFATTRNERAGTEDSAGNLKEHAVVLDLEETLNTLRPGNTARVELTSVLAEDVLIIPLVAVREMEDGRSYVKLSGGESRVVKLGLATPTHAEVLEGLEAGQKIELVATTSDISATEPGTTGAQAQ